MSRNLRRLVGLDTRADEYAYAVDPVAGYISAQKAPDRWIKTTCGYCSVGCGMKDVWNRIVPSEARPSMEYGPVAAGRAGRVTIWNAGSNRTLSGLTIPLTRRVEVRCGSTTLAASVTTGGLRKLMIRP